MQLLVLILASMLWVPLMLTPGYSAGIRTYRFVADGSLPYTESCDDCSSPLLGIRADIQGTFSLILDRSAGTGALLSLDSRVVNVVDILRARAALSLSRVVR